MAGCAKGIEHHKACRSGVRRRSRAAMGSSGIARGGVGTCPSNFKWVHRHTLIDQSNKPLKQSDFGRVTLIEQSTIGVGLPNGTGLAMPLRGRLSAEMLQSYQQVYGSSQYDLVPGK